MIKNVNIKLYYIINVTNIESFIQWNIKRRVYGYKCAYRDTNAHIGIPMRIYGYQ